MANKDMNEDISKMSKDANLITPTIVTRPEDQVADVETFQLGNVIDDINASADAIPSPRAFEYSSDVNSEPAKQELYDKNILDYEPQSFTGEEVKVAVKVPKDLEGLLPKKKVTKVIDKKPPLSPLNYDKIDSEELLLQHMDTVARAKGLDKLEKVDFNTLQSELIKPEFAVTANGKSVKIFKDQKSAERYIKESTKEAKLTNRDVPDFQIVEQPVYSEEFIKDVISPKVQGGTIADYKEIYKQFQFLADVSQRAYDLGVEVVKLKSINKLTKDKLAEFRHAVALEGVVAARMKKKQVDIARSLSVLNVARKPGANQVRVMDEALEEFGGEQAIAEFAERYVAEADRSTRIKMAEAMEIPAWKRVAEMWSSIYVTGLITQIDSHLRNIIGYAGLRGLTIPENYLAVGWGKVLGTKERMLIQEANAGAAFEARYWAKAWVAFKESFIHNRMTDQANKVMTSPVGKRAFEYNFGNAAHEKFAAKGIEWMGAAATISGRLMMSVDEFNKTLAYWRSMEMQVAKREVQEVERLMKTGMSHDDASEAAAQLAKELLESPTQDMIEEAVQFGRYQTATQQSVGALAKVENMINNPFLKVWMPFFRVINNVTTAALERSPITAFFTPRVWRNLRAGGVQRDLALAKITAGTGWGGMIVWQTQSGRITGAGTFGNYEDRVAAERQGWQAYSFIFENGELSEEKIKFLKSVTDVSITKDKVYVSYQGIEPISILLAQWSSMAEFAFNKNAQTEDIDLLYTAAALSTYDYMIDHPFLQTMGDIAKLFDHRKTVDGTVDALFSTLGQKYGEYFVQGAPGIPMMGSVPVTINGETQLIGGPWSGFKADLEKYIYPDKDAPAPLEMKEWTANRNSINAAVDGWISSFGKICAKTMGCSTELPKALDPITGKRLQNGLGNIYDLWGPFKTTKGLTPGAYTILAEYGANLPDPYKDYKTYEGVTLSGDQLNKLIKIATRDIGLESIILQKGKELKYNKLMTKAQKAAALNEIMSNVYSASLQQLVVTDDRLSAAIERVKFAKEREINQRKSTNTLMGDR